MTEFPKVNSRVSARKVGGIMRAQRVIAPTVRVAIEDLLATKVSMLEKAMLPAGYSDVESWSDVHDEMTKPTDDPRIARLTIVWDNPISGDFPLSEVLDMMRGTGAAMVTSVEEVK